MSEFSRRTIEGRASSRGNTQAETHESLEYSDVSRDSSVKKTWLEDEEGSTFLCTGDQEQLWVCWCLHRRLVTGNSLENLVPKCLGLSVKWTMRLRLLCYIEASAMQR